MNKKNLKKILISIGMVFSISSLSASAMQKVNKFNTEKENINTTSFNSLKMEIFKKFVEQPLLAIKKSDPLLYMEKKKSFDASINKIINTLKYGFTNNYVLEKVLRQTLNMILDINIDYQLENLKIENSKKQILKYRINYFKNKLLNNFKLCMKPTGQIFVNIENMEHLNLNIIGKTTTYKSLYNDNAIYDKMCSLHKEFFYYINNFLEKKDSFDDSSNQPFNTLTTRNNYVKEISKKQIFEDNLNDFKIKLSNNFCIQNFLNEKESFDDLNNQLFNALTTENTDIEKTSKEILKMILDVNIDHKLKNLKIEDSEKQSFKNNINDFKDKLLENFKMCMKPNGQFFVETINMKYLKNLNITGTTRVEKSIYNEMFSLYNEFVSYIQNLLEKL